MSIETARHMPEVEEQPNRIEEILQLPPTELIPDSKNIQKFSTDDLADAASLLFDRLNKLAGRKKWGPEIKESEGYKKWTEIKNIIKAREKFMARMPELTKTLRRGMDEEKMKQIKPGLRETIAILQPSVEEIRQKRIGDLMENIMFKMDNYEDVDMGRLINGLSLEEKWDAYNYLADKIGAGGGENTEKKLLRIVSDIIGIKKVGEGPMKLSDEGTIIEEPAPVPKPKRVAPIKRGRQKLRTGGFGGSANNEKETNTPVAGTMRVVEPAKRRGARKDVTTFGKGLAAGAAAMGIYAATTGGIGGEGHKYPDTTIQPKSATIQVVRPEPKTDEWRGKEMNFTEGEVGEGVNKRTRQGLPTKASKIIHRNQIPIETGNVEETFASRIAENAYIARQADIRRSGGTFKEIPERPPVPEDDAPFIGAANPTGGLTGAQWYDKAREERNKIIRQENTIEQAPIPPIPPSISGNVELNIQDTPTKPPVFIRIKDWAKKIFG